MKKLLISFLVGLVVTVAPVMASTITVPDDYTTIQAAINAANSGDTIEVAGGTYDLSSPIVVDESVRITGDTANPSNVVINAPTSGDKDCFEIEADDVTIQGFRIQGARDNPSNGWGSGVAIGNYGAVFVQNTVVSHNEIYDNSYGIYLYSAQHVEISDNEIWGSAVTDAGCFNGKGIEVYGENLAGVGDGSNPAPNDIDILNNDIHDNDLFGIELNVWDNGDTTDFVDVDVTINGNTIYNNGGPLANWDCWDGTGYALHRGISGNDYTKDVTITNNEIYEHWPESGYTFIGSDGVGIRAYKGKNWNIKENDIHDNMRGIYAYADSEEFLIEGNDIYDNAQGIAVGDGDVGETHFNNIHGNDVTTYTSDGIDPYGVVNLATGTVVFDATNNWWGDESGPYHETSNPSGQGDAVSDNVDFDPWLEFECVEDDVFETPEARCILGKLYEVQNKVGVLEERVTELEETKLDLDDWEEWKIKIEDEISGIWTKLKEVEDFTRRVFSCAMALSEPFYGCLEQPTEDWEDHCGNGKCETEKGETATSCPADCKPEVVDNEVLLMKSWKVTCPPEFTYNKTNYTTNHCRAEMLRNGRSLTNRTLEPGDSWQVNRNAGYSIKLYGDTENTS